MVLLAAALYPAYFMRKPSPLRRGVALASAAALVAALALAGHAAAGTGLESLVQESADVLHLLAAASWVGSLVPLALLLGAAASERSESSLAVACTVTLRFSTLGIASVATVLGSGIINTGGTCGQRAGARRHRLRPPSLGKSRAVPRHDVGRCGQSAEPYPAARPGPRPCRAARHAAPASHQQPDRSQHRGNHPHHRRHAARWRPATSRWAAKGLPRSFRFPAAS